MLDRKLNVWWTGLTLLVSSFLVYCYMAFRKPRPIGQEIDFSDQSIEVDVSPINWIHLLNNFIEGELW